MMMMMMLMMMMMMMMMMTMMMVMMIILMRMLVMMMMIMVMMTNRILMIVNVNPPQGDDRAITCGFLLAKDSSPASVTLTQHTLLHTAFTHTTVAANVHCHVTHRHWEEQEWATEISMRISLKLCYCLDLPTTPRQLIGKMSFGHLRRLFLLIPVNLALLLSRLFKALK